MLNPFPTLLSFAILAPFIIRVALGIFFIYIAFHVIYQSRDKFYGYYKKHKYPIKSTLVWFFGGLTGLVGLFFIVGFLTQIISIVAIYLLSSLYLTDKELEIFKYTKVLYLFLGVICLCMILLGAGAFAIDLPL